VDEIGYGDRGERPQRSTEFERDSIGRLLAKLNADARQDYTYDDGDRLLSIARLPTANGKKLGVSEEKLDFAYDLLGRLIKESTPQGTLSYDYDPLSNLTTLTLPTGQHLNHLYYGSGHLHQLNLDGQLISDMDATTCTAKCCALKARSPVVLAMTRWAARPGNSPRLCRQKNSRRFLTRASSLNYW
jgi:YD repeat-containing protein